MGIYRVVILVLILILASFASVSALQEIVDNRVMENLGAQEEVDVIIELKDDDSADLQDKKQKISEKQNKVLSKLESKEFKLEHKYSTVGSFAGKLTEQGLKKLQKDPDVKHIFFDEIHQITLDQSIPQINADAVWQKQVNDEYLTGKGETVCVIDTGVDYTHPDLGGGWGNKVIAGHDYINNDTNPMDDHNHGTHVAGIVASENPTYKGVAPDAKLVAIKVCDASGLCPTSKINAGIDWCVDNAETYNISVITISIGSGSYSTFCRYYPSDPHVDNAVEQGIAVTIASGNCDGVSCTSGISAPACVENAIPVGGVYISDLIKYQRWDLFQLLAPAMGIRSTIIGGGTRSSSGTSMAAPHVAGAIALIQQASMLQDETYLTSDEIKTLLSDTGVSVFDSGTGNTYKRIDVLAAIDNFIFLNYITSVSLNDDAVSITADEDVSCITNLDDNETYKLIYDWQKDSDSLIKINLPFEANNGFESTQTKDYTTDNDAVVNGATWLQNGGQDGFGAYSFDGDNDKITLEGHHTPGPRTYTFWMKSTDTGPSSVFNHGSIFNGGFQINWGADRPIFGLHNQNYIYWEDNPAQDDGQWHFWALSTDGADAGNTELFIDGVKQTASSIKFSEQVRQWYSLVLGYTSTSSVYFDGILDEFKVWDLQLSQEQINELYQNDNVIVSSETNEGDSWKACVTPNDNVKDEKGICSNSLSITAGTGSSLQTVEIDAGASTTDDDLTANTNLDGNSSFKLIYDWIKDNVSLLSLNLPFEANNGLEQVTTEDYSGDKDVTISGATWMQTGGQDSFGAYQFDGTDDKISVDGDDAAGAKTYTFWAKSTITTYNPVFSHGSIFQGGFAFNWVADRPIFGLDNKNFRYWVANDAQDDGNWHFYTLVLTGTSPADIENSKLYIDGNEQAVSRTYSTGALKPWGNLEIGYTETADLYFDGSLDDFKIWNSALSQEQIESLYVNDKVIVSSETNVGDSWQVCVTSNDGYDDKDEICSSEIVIV